MRQDGYLNITHESESGINFIISNEHAASRWRMMYGKFVQLFVDYVIIKIIFLHSFICLKL